jgi:sugar phosphate isomerase/epimerase
MRRGLSTFLLVNHRLTTVWLDRIWDAGIPLVEMYCARQHLDYHDKAQIAELGYWFRDSELKVHALHSPLFSDDVWGKSGPGSVMNIMEPVKSRRMAVVDEIKRALDIAEIIPFRYLVQHVGVPGEEFDMRKVDSAFSSLEEIHVFARQRGVEVLLENTVNSVSTAEKLLMFFELTHMNFNICLDVGHANIQGGVETVHRLLKSRILSTHVHDNNGKDDLHLFPFAPGGTVDWTRTMELLRQDEDRHPLVLELAEPPDTAHPLVGVRELFEKLEGLRPKHES